MENAFIKQTSLDYSLPYHIVEAIYKKWYDEGLFYEKLEEHLRENNYYFIWSCQKFYLSL